MRRRLKFILAGLALLLAGCSAHSDYVKADALTYDAIAPDYSAYVAHDTALSPEEKGIRLHLVDTWKLRLEKNR